MTRDIGSMRAGGGTMAVEADEKPSIVRLDCSSELDNLERIRAFVRECCRRAPGPGWEPDDVDQLELAVNEAVSNIIRHEYHGQAGRPLELQVELWPDRMVVQLRSWGEAFKPAAIGLPGGEEQLEGGLGLFIIANCVDDVAYEPHADGGNCVRLLKYKSK